MATNNDGHLLDSAGNVAVDFVWGNMPLQPNDVRPVGSKLSYGIDTHNIAEDGWNGYPQYTPNNSGTQSGGVDYITVPSVLGMTTAIAQDTLQDVEMTITTATAATNSPLTVTAVSRASGGVAVLTATGAGAAFPIGTKVTIASVDATVNGTWTVTDHATNTLSVATTTTTSLSLTGLSGSVVGVSGTIKTQSVAAGASSISAGAAITITPFA
jgi:hypothetical protein